MSSTHCAGDLTAVPVSFGTVVTYTSHISEDRQYLSHHAILTTFTGQRPCCLQNVCRSMQGLHKAYGWNKGCAVIPNVTLPVDLLKVSSIITSRLIMCPTITSTNYYPNMYKPKLRWFLQILLFPHTILFELENLLLWHLQCWTIWLFLQSVCLYLNLTSLAHKLNSLLCLITSVK